jgi:hypothetical protein
MRRCKLHLLCCVATLIFAAVPVAIMLPLAAYLDPSFLARLDAAALAVVRRLPRAVVGAIGAADDVWSEGDSDDSDDSDDSAGSGRHAFRVGQVFKHKVKRYTGAITRLTPAGERGEHGLGTGDVWYSALIDQRYSKSIGQSEVFVAESEIERMYPGSRDGFLHPKRDNFFRSFDPEDSAFVPKLPGKKKNKNAKTAKDTKSATGQKKKSKKKSKKAKTDL